MTPTAWVRGIKNASICGVIFLSGWWLTARVTAIVFHRPLVDSYLIAYAVLWSLIFSLFLGTWLYGRNAGGGVLLDCGPHPTRVIFLIYAALFLGVGLVCGSTVGQLPKSFQVACPVFCISFGVYWLIMASGRLQIRRDGLWQYWALLRWEKIESCRWSGDSTLLVRAKSLLPFLGQGALPVPPKDKQAVAELLQKYCSVWDRDF
jgi:hypothetical protein